MNKIAGFGFFFLTLFCIGVCVLERSNHKPRVSAVDGRVEILPKNQGDGYFLYASGKIDSKNHFAIYKPPLNALPSAEPRVYMGPIDDFRRLKVRSAATELLPEFSPGLVTAIEAEDGMFMVYDVHNVELSGTFNGQPFHQYYR